jgi:hypothetical protein
LKNNYSKTRHLPVSSFHLTLFFLCLVVLAFSYTAWADDGINSSSEEERWSSFLPIWGEEARERGYDLPLPFGITANFMFMKQDFDVESIELDIGEIHLDLPDSVVGGYVSGEDFSMVMRFGAWVFPFLNIYAIAGYTDGETSTHVLIPLGSEGGRAISFPFTLDYKGPTLGGGMTLAGGVRNIFTVLDLNYTETDLDIADSQITALVFSPRIGWQDTIGSWKGSFWVGCMYQDVEQTIKGSVRLSQIPKSIDFEVKQKAAKPWNMTLGMLFNATPSINFTLEAGFIGRDQILTSLGYRF